MQRGTIVISVGSFILLYFLLVIYLKNGAINAYMDRYLAVLLFLYCSILIYLSTDKLFILPVYPLIIVLAILFAFGQLFFLITGFHGFHVFSGVVINCIVCAMAATGSLERRGHYEMVEKVGLYWHFVDLVWIFVFLAFYLL